MSVYYLSYDLQNGYIHNWLVAGPLAIPVPDLDRFAGNDFKSQITCQYYVEDSDVTQLPLEGAPLKMGDSELAWKYVRCLDDHYVDLTAFYDTCHFLRSWAYARVMSPSAQDVTIVLTTNGPADLWLNGQHVHRQEHFHHRIPRSISFPASLDKGHNEILVRLEEVAIRECPYAMALQIPGLPFDDAADETRVLLPTSIKAIARRQHLERAFEAAYLDRNVYAWRDVVTVRWPEEMATSANVAVRFQTPSGRIYAESSASASPGNHAHLSRPTEIPEGPYQVILMPRPQEYYEWNMRIQRKIGGLWSLRHRYSQTPYGTYQERRLEALEYAAGRGNTIFSEMAKMALGRWHQVKDEVILEAVEKISQRQDCSDFHLIGLLGIMHRYGNHPSFPKTLKTPVEECALGFRYWIDEPGNDAMCFWSENHQILFHACEILAGQLYPDRVFPNAGQTGQWHREKGERMAISWLRKRCTGGFQEWDSSCCFDTDLLALSYLVDLAENQQVWELAAVLMDKVFFTVAVNSYRGVFGSTHGRAYAAQIKGGRLEPTTGISRLMWGMGTFNHHIRGMVSVACAEEYELPSIIQEIAADLPEEMWNRERHSGNLEEWCDCATGSWEVNKVTFKTPDYMLCSAQDYHPGEEGLQQHIWQATLGPDAVVFVTHPSCVSEQSSHRPSFWHGNSSLPRVAQWKDVLVAIHRPLEDDWLGFTHAYFPVYAFDEHSLQDGWAFARKGGGYLALTAARGLELITRGDNAYRELRSYGQHNVWLCHMGRAADNGGFGAFQEKVLALKLGFEGLSVRWATLRGQHLAFSWEGPLLVDGEEQPITGFKHYDNPYCETDWPVLQMDIRFRDQLLRLEFGL